MNTIKNNFLRFALFLFATTVFAQTDKVSVEKNDAGMKLVVNGKDFMINGMNWDFIPIGTNTINADFWNKSDDIIKAGLDTEMSLLKNMNVNVSIPVFLLDGFNTSTKTMVFTQCLMILSVGTDLP